MGIAGKASGLNIIKKDWIKSISNGLVAWFSKYGQAAIKNQNTINLTFSIIKGYIL